jgi:hypothetical protein
MAPGRSPLAERADEALSVCPYRVKKKAPDKTPPPGETKLGGGAAKTSNAHNPAALTVRHCGKMNKYPAQLHTVFSPFAKALEAMELPACVKGFKNAHAPSHWRNK